MIEIINILNSAKKPLAVLENYFGDEITEQINGSYTLKFSVYMDDEKSQYIATGNYVEVEDQLFNIVHHRRTRSDNGDVVIAVESEQVSYDLLFHLFEGGFIHTGSPQQLIQMVLEGTGFTIGTVQPTGYISVDLKEGVNARGVLMEIAAQSGGELHFDKYTVSLLNRRGQDRGVQFRLGKNLKGIVKDVNGQSGEILTAYEVDVVELNTLPEFEGIEYFELGDTVDIIDEELDIDEQQRIIQYSYSPKLRINSAVVISNYIDGIQDTIYRIQTTTVGKDKWMYGVKIGPDEGVVIERYDKMAKSIWNADEFRMQKGNGSGTYSDALFFDPINQEYEFTGVVRASEFIGGSIQIGSNFSVNETGHMKAVSGEFNGKIEASEIVGGEVIGASIKTALSGRRIELNVNGLMSYDSNNENRIRINTTSDSGVSALSFFGSGGEFAGEINSYGNQERLNIFSNDLFFGSNSTSNPIYFQGRSTFNGQVTFNSYITFLQGIDKGDVNGLESELESIWNNINALWSAINTP